MNKIIITKIITFYSLIYGIDPKISLSVVEIESAFNSNSIGITGDVGLFGLNPKSFPSYTINELKDPVLNTELGIKYLAKMKKECKHKEGITWLVCYNFGLKNAEKVKYPQLFPYIKKIKRRMKYDSIKV